MLKQFLQFCLIHLLKPGSYLRSLNTRLNVVAAERLKCISAQINMFSFLVARFSETAVMSFNQKIKFVCVEVLYETNTFYLMIFFISVVL